MNQNNANDKLWWYAYLCELVSEYYHDQTGNIKMSYVEHEVERHIQYVWTAALEMQIDYGAPVGAYDNETVSYFYLLIAADLNWDWENSNG